MGATILPGMLRIFIGLRAETFFGLLDIPDDVTHLNCAYYSSQLNETRARLHRGVDGKGRPGQLISARMPKEGWGVNFKPPTVSMGNAAGQG